MAIALKWEGFQAHYISGFLFSVEAFINAQGLNAHFGRADHKKHIRGEDIEKRLKERL